MPSNFGINTSIGTVQSTSKVAVAFEGVGRSSPDSEPTFNVSGWGLSRNSIVPFEIFFVDKSECYVNKRIELILEKKNS